MRRRAFTLIELLVSVAILGLLASILLPSLRSAREQARKVVCASNLRQVGVGVYNYWTAENGRVPDVITPFNNAAFLDPARSDADLDPFDRVRWPQSLPNVLMPQHMGEQPDVFVCPSAVSGWPRRGPFRYTYWEAARNQPNGTVEPERTYLREAFGFLDGRMWQRFRMELRAGNGNRPADLIHDTQEWVKSRGTFMRDMIRLRRPGVDAAAIGPHRGGAWIINRNLEVEFRDQKTISEDLAANGVGAPF